MSLYSRILKKIILPLSEFLFKIPLTLEQNKLDKLTHLTAVEIETIQKDKLSKVLHYAVSNSKYYKNFHLNLNPDSPVGSLKSFPILTKKDIKKNTDSLLTQPKEQLIKNSSSGSTGEQTVVYWSKKEQTLNRATQLLWWNWAGYAIGDRLIQTGITPERPGLKKYKDLLFRTKYIQAFSHNTEDLEKTLKNLLPNQKYTLAGYASSLFVISQIALEKDLNLNFKTAISWGDKLFDHYKKSIYDAFHCKTYETYGSAEGFMMAAQKDLDYMYLMATNVYIEIVDDSGNELEDGRLGHIIVTNLNGYAMPLIRYKIGDLGIKLPHKNYPKNRELQLPLIQKVIGRDTDIVKTPSGNFLVVHSFTGIFEHFPQIKQFCVIQRDLTGIHILYIKDAGFENEILDVIRLKILHFLDEAFEINFEEVAVIKPTPSGKPQLIISHLVQKDNPNSD